MKKLLIIGGMGAGKSTVAHALAAFGLPEIDLDDIAHEVLEDEKTRQGLAAVFGADVLDERGKVRRSLLASRAFSSAQATRVLNDLTQPRIYARFRQRLAACEAAGAPAVVVEYPLFPQERELYVEPGDVIVAVTAPLEARVARAAAAGFDPDDVRRRIAAQVGDEERLSAADVVFVNNSTPEALADEVRAWWTAQEAGRLR